MLTTTLRRGIRAILVLFWVLTGALISALAGVRGRTVSIAVMAFWSRGLCRLMGVRITRRGVPAEGSVLFVANHISWLDIFCIAAVCPTHFLAKQDVATWPIFGWLCRRAGTAFIRRGAENGASDTIEQMVWRLRQGDRMLVFPEGTSTTGESVKRFYPRLFQIAIHARCPVQAIALRYPDLHDPRKLNSKAPFVGDDNFISHLWRLLGESRIKVEAHFNEPLAVENQSRNDLSRRTYTQISAALGFESGQDSALCPKQELVQ